MKPENVAQLCAAVREYNLLPAERQRELEESIVKKFDKPMMLAWELLRLGWLTAFQVDQLLRASRPELNVGHYRLLARLGQGGVCRVFKAEDTRTGAIVALKVLQETYSENSEIIRRFQREIETITKLDHPNVVKAHDVHLTKGTGWLAMEYLAGNDLGRVLEKKEVLPVYEACDYIRQSALGLHHIYENGLVHRDIKPANLFVTDADKIVKLLDLGLVRNRLSQPTDPSGSVTMERNILGTPDYIAPEQARSPKTVDIRADIYSLGCTFFELLIGRPPFEGSNAMEKLMKHQTQEPPLVHRERPSVPREVGLLIADMLKKKREERPETPMDVAMKLLKHSKPPMPGSI